MKPLSIFLLAVLALAAVARADSAFERDYQAWCASRDASLRRTDGWLTLAGLFWLSPGESSFGSGADNKVRFPSGPARIGTFRLGADGVLTVDTDVPLADGRRHVVLDPRAPEGQQELRLGSLSWYLIQRDGRSAIRLKDSASPTLSGFHGVPRYPADPAWRLTARFEPYPKPVIRRVPTAQGTMQDEPCVGRIAFEVGGKPYTLEAYAEEGEDDLFVIFGDATNGHETYPAGRYLYVPKPKGGQTTVIDFNRAYNPPCAFTPFATCSYPTRQNRLTIAVTAGEKNPHRHAATR
jgi:uncharacterized protein (DUF1684 family)